MEKNIADKSGADKQESSQDREIKQDERRERAEELTSIYLKNLWGELATNLTIGPTDNDGFNRFLAIHADIRLEELFIKPVSERSQMLAGETSEAITQATKELNTAGDDREYLIAYLRNVISATLREWIRRGNTSTEEQVDLVIMPLLRNNIFPNEEYSAVHFAAGLEATLLAGRPQPLTYGYLQTWGAIADWMRKSDFRLCQIWSITSYSRLIEAVLTEQNPTEKMLSLVAANANSLASTLDDLGERTEGQLTVMNRCHLLTPLFRAKPEHTPQQQNLAASVMERLGFAEHEHSQKDIWRLNQMMRVSRSWELLDPQIFSRELLDYPVDANKWNEKRYSLLLLLYISAGFVRACLVDENDFDEPTSSFFNATVQLNRLGTKLSSYRYLSALQLRLLVGSIGLWWALRATDDAEQAAGEFNGYDCLVNLTATVANDKQWFDKAVQDACTNLVLLAYQYGPSGDRKRLTISFSKLGFDSKQLEESKPAPITQIRSATELLLTAITQQCGIPLNVTELHSNELRQSARYLAELLQPLLESVIDAYDGVNAYQICIGLVSQLLQNLEILSTTKTTLLAEKLWPEAEMAGINLLRSAQINLPGAWQETLHAYQDKAPESLPSFIKEHANPVFAKTI